MYYGLHKNGNIVKIWGMLKSLEKDPENNEIFHDLGWSYESDFTCIAKRKRTVKFCKRMNKKIRKVIII